MPPPGAEARSEILPSGPRSRPRPLPPFIPRADPSKSIGQTHKTQETPPSPTSCTTILPPQNFSTNNTSQETGNRMAPPNASGSPCQGASPRLGRLLEEHPHHAESLVQPGPRPQEGGGWMDGSG